MATKTSRGSSAARSRNGSSAQNGDEARERKGSASSGLDSVLSDATQGPLRRWFPGRAMAASSVRLATQPQSLVKRTVGLGAELAKVAAGRSEVAPPKGDRRFKDPAWEGNPAFRRLAQSYLAYGRAVDGLVSDLDLDWRTERRLRFAIENVLDALAPTNFPQLNPAVLKATLDSGGANLLKGARQFASDMSRPPRIPSMVDTSAFEVGENIATTPGAVVLRTEVLELIQYEPTTPKVREQPLLIVPPMINKYYVTDLEPEKSMIRFLVESGQQVFAISWRNPDERHSDWTLDTYAEAALEALAAVERISARKRTQVLGLCAGGILLAALAAHLEAEGERGRLAGITLGVCALDNERAGTASAFMDPAVAAAAISDSARKGYLDGRSLAGVFAWLRPNDLVWNYWVNNYLLGKDPPAFDILYWNSDATNLPAGLHRDFIRLSMDNSLAKPGEAKLLGTPVDLAKVTTDSYVVAGIADHIVPWKSAYRTTQLLGGKPRFVLSTSGHIAALVNPPGSEKASFRTNPDNPEEADAWLEGASEKRGTWWEDWVAWLSERSGEERNPPRRLGRKGLDPIDPAPGKYVKAAA